MSKATTVKNRDTDIVRAFKARILVIDKEFDAIVADLKTTPMTKAEYDKISEELYAIASGSMEVAQEL